MTQNSFLCEESYQCSCQGRGPVTRRTAQRHWNAAVARARSNGNDILRFPFPIPVQIHTVSSGSSSMQSKSISPSESSDMEQSQKSFDRCNEASGDISLSAPATQPGPSHELLPNHASALALAVALLPLPSQNTAMFYEETDELSQDPSQLPDGNVEDSVQPYNCEESSDSSGPRELTIQERAMLGGIFDTRLHNFMRCHSWLIGISLKHSCTMTLMDDLLVQQATAYESFKGALQALIRESGLEVTTHPYSSELHKALTVQYLEMESIYYVTLLIVLKLRAWSSRSLTYEYGRVLRFVSKTKGKGHFCRNTTRKMLKFLVKNGTPRRDASQIFLWYVVQRSLRRPGRLLRHQTRHIFDFID